MTRDEDRLRHALEKAYLLLNRREYVEPDPLQFLYRYDDVRDREIAGLVASCLALGNVRQILKSVSLALEIISKPSPSAFLRETSNGEIRRAFSGFKHRFITGEGLAGLLASVKREISRSGSLEACFKAGMADDDETVVPAIERFAKTLNPHGRIMHLLPLPSAGSACKRLNLYLRWMVRCDAVDPGGWDRIPASKLVVPLDTHMWKIGTGLKFTERKQAGLKAAIDITRSFARICPEDPVKYDFCLTRLGIRKDPESKEVSRIIREDLRVPDTSRNMRRRLMLI